MNCYSQTSTKNRFWLAGSLCLIWLIVPVASGQDGFGLTGNADLADFPVMTQPDGISCGPTCCSMLLKYYGKSAGIGPLKTAAGTRFYEGPNFTGQKIKVGMTHPSGIVNALASYGVFPVREKGSIESVKNLINQQKPPILLVRSGGSTWHYVVAIGHRYNVPKARKEIKLADPSGVPPYWIDEATLNGAWQFSNDLSGKPTEGARCATCGGSGSHSVGPLKTKCVVCNGNKREPDFYRKIVETSGVSGHTMIYLKHSAGGGSSGGNSSGGGSSGGTTTGRIDYTIWNDTPNTVEFRLPTGKVYTLAPGARGKYYNTGSADNLKIEVLSTGKRYTLKSGDHKFWWKKDEKRLAFDLNYKK